MPEELAEGGLAANDKNREGFFEPETLESILFHTPSSFSVRAGPRNR